MSSHTPDDLYVKPLADGFALYDDHEQHPIATARNEGNAGRLAACWNYCQGINTHDLEQGTLSALMDSVRGIEREVGRMREASIVELLGGAIELANQFAAEHPRETRADAARALADKLTAFVQQAANAPTTTLEGERMRGLIEERDALKARIEEVRAYDYRMDHADDPQAPTGDDYNEVLSLLGVA